MKKSFLNFDVVLQWLKRWQFRFFFSDYSDYQNRRKWYERESPSYEQFVLPLFSPSYIPKSILIFKPDDIGDAVLGLPAIRELKKAFPVAKLYLICQHKTRSLYESTGLFDEISSVAVKVWLLRFRTLDIARALLGLSETKFDIAIFLRTYPSYFRAFKKIPARRRLHPLDPRLTSNSIYRVPIGNWGDNLNHQALQLLQLVSPLIGRSFNESDIQFPNFKWKEKDKLSVVSAVGKKLPKQYFVLHPFVQYETRRYPYAYWKEIVVQLKEQFGFPLFIIGGPTDPNLDLGKGVDSLQGKLTLSQTGHLISKSSGFLGIASGPAHLAAASGVPTVVLLSGHELPLEWAPLGKTLLLRKDVPCSPCYRRTCPVFKLACLTQLRPEHIRAPIDSFLTEAMAEKPVLAKESKSIINTHPNNTERHR